MLTVVTEDGSTRGGSLIDEIAREGARRMVAATLEAEVNAFMAELANEEDERGRRLVVRNGNHQPRNVTAAAGTVSLDAAAAQVIEQGGEAEGGPVIAAVVGNLGPSPTVTSRRRRS